MTAMVMLGKMEKLSMENALISMGLKKIT